MLTKSTSGLGLVLLIFLWGCQTELAALGIESPGGRLSYDFNDVEFTMTACEITADRSAICKVRITNRYRDKRIGIDRRITLQDNLGNDYQITQGGFGDPSVSRAQWFQTAVADSSYELTVIATNLSTRAESVRAVVFTRLGVLTPTGQTIGYRDGVIFSNPKMVGAEVVASAAATSDSGPSGDYSGDEWHWVGYWNYDGEDGQYLAQGVVLRNIPGEGLGKPWQARLELNKHTELREKPRTLWPVQLNTAQRRVCADYPEYPSYQAFIDMPGNDEDGVYQFARCSGGG